jgi:hypothetical protein
VSQPERVKGALHRSVEIELGGVGAPLRHFRVSLRGPTGERALARKRNALREPYDIVVGAGDVERFGSVPGFPAERRIVICRGLRRGEARRFGSLARGGESRIRAARFGEHIGEIEDAAGSLLRRRMTNDR